MTHDKSNAYDIFALMDERETRLFDAFCPHPTQPKAQEADSSKTGRRRNKRDFTARIFTKEQRQVAFLESAGGKKLLHAWHALLDANVDELQMCVPFAPDDFSGQFLPSSWLQDKTAVQTMATAIATHLLIYYNHFSGKKADQAV